MFWPNKTLRDDQEFETKWDRRTVLTVSTVSAKVLRQVCRYQARISGGEAGGTPGTYQPGSQENAAISTPYTRVEGR